MADVVDPSAPDSASGPPPAAAISMAGLPPPPPPPLRSKPRDRLSLVIPAMLAAIGLAAALIAWRTSVAAGAADAATQAGLNAARQRAASIIVGEGLTARSTEAYIDRGADPVRERLDDRVRTKHAPCRRAGPGGAPARC